MKCPTGGYSPCFAQSDFAVAFLDTSFQHTFAYGYGSSLPSQETVYTAGALAACCSSAATSSSELWC